MAKDFLRTWDWDLQTIKELLNLTRKLKEAHEKGKDLKVFASGLAVSIFRDQSTRTRYSFKAAANLLGLDVDDFDEKKSQVKHGETLLETVNMISFLTRAIGIRDDIYLGLGHRYMIEVSKALDWGFKNKIFSQRPTIINLQSDEDHPSQSLSDLCHLTNYFGSLENLRGKKMVMSWAHSPSYGKPLSVPQGFIALLSRFGVDLTLAYPEGYDLIPEIINQTKIQAKKSGGHFKIVHDIAQAFSGAEVVYPKSWAPFWVMKERTRLLKMDDELDLKELEKKTLAENAKHQDWTCSEKLMKLTKKGSALYMHCLPADISGMSCEKGEVDKNVFEKYRKETYLQAGYKPFVIAALILLGDSRLESLIT